MSTRTASCVIVSLALVLSACAGDPASSGESSDPTTAVTTGPTTVSTETTTPEMTEELAELDEAEQRWTDTGKATYSYTYRQSCECDDAAMGPNTVSVVDGEVVAVRMDRQGTAGFDPDAVAPPGQTVAQLFTMIRAAIERGEQVMVTYDADLGHPILVRLDLEAIPVDGGFDFEIVSFEMGSAERVALSQARDRWNAAGLSDYTYTYRPQCFCVPSAIEVTVVNGAVQSHLVLEGELFGEFLSIEDLFGFIDDALARQPFSIDVEYDGSLGYPRSVWVDYEQNMADEEMGYTVELIQAG